MAQLIGVVLAGGAGRRMGRPKGGLVVDGASLTQRAVAALWPLCGSVLVSVAPGGKNPAPEFATVEDEPPAGRGPLAGIAAAFAASGRADLLVLACDYPGVDTVVLSELPLAIGRNHDLALLTDASGRDHPLVALWRRSAESAVREALSEGRLKVRALLPDLEVLRLGPDRFPGRDLDHILKNLNTPEDLDGE